MYAVVKRLAIAAAAYAAAHPQPRSPAARGPAGRRKRRATVIAADDEVRARVARALAAVEAEERAEYAGYMKGGMPSSTTSSGSGLGTLGDLFKGKLQGKAKSSH